MYQGDNFLLRDVRLINLKVKLNLLSDTRILGVVHTYGDSVKECFDGLISAMIVQAYTNKVNHESPRFK